jgi:hypothetical protein
MVYKIKKQGIKMKELNGVEVVVLTETEKATKNLLKVVADANKVISQMDSFTEAVESINEQVAVKSIELKKLSDDVEMKARENKIELNLKVRENEESVLQSILKARKLVTIEPDELNEIQTAAYQNEKDLQNAVSKAETILSKQLSDKYSSDIKIKDLEYSAKTADSKAQIENLTKEITYLKNALKEANDRAAAELEARIKIASESKAITVNTVSK